MKNAQAGAFKLDAIDPTDLPLPKLLALLNDPEMYYSMQGHKLLDSIDIAQVIVELNNKGMGLLSQCSFSESFAHLRAAERLLRIADEPKHIHHEDRKKLMGLTCNNLGCYYKRCKKPNVALRYMHNALDLELSCRLPGPHTSSTKLNICAILSLLKRHREARKYAASAVSDLLAELRLIRLKVM